MSLNAALNAALQGALQDETKLALGLFVVQLSGFEHSAPERFVAPLFRVQSNDVRDEMVSLPDDDRAANSQQNSKVRSSADNRPKATRDRGVDSSLRSR